MEDIRRTDTQTKVVKYVPDATFVRGVACLGTDLFKFPGCINIGKFSAEDEQKLKLVLVHPQIPQ